MRAAIILTALAAGLAGCASAPNAPDWADTEGYPSLRDVPRESRVNTDASYWAAVQTDLTLAGQEVRTHQRSEPASATQSPEEFLAEARRELEQARLAHEPN
jgi:hypothetical protein